MSADPLVSIVIPVKNGSGKLQNCLDSLMRQDFPRELFEIIVADGRSTDDTADIARAHGCRVVDNPRETVAGGRNVGVAAARGAYVAFSEDDIVLPPHWLSEGVRTLSDPSIAAVGGPTPIPDSSSAFARAVDLIFRAAACGGYSVQSGLLQERHEARDLPGGNAMYRRECLASAPMDEGLITGEDVDLHLRLRKQGYRLIFSPDFTAWHHKRDSPRRFFRQIRRFAQGRVQVGRRHAGALRPLHWLIASAPPAVLAVLAASSPAVAVAAAAVFGCACVGAALICRVGTRASLWMPLVAGLFLLAWPIGFFQELLRPTRDATGK